MAVQVLKENGMHAYTPQGAFYILVDISASRIGSHEFAMKLLEKKHVAVAPGSTFGKLTADYVRVAFSVREEEVREGMQRLCSFVKECEENSRHQ